MGKRKIQLSTITILLFFLFTDACKKIDSKAPDVLINGATNQTVFLQGTYVEMGIFSPNSFDLNYTETTNGVSSNVNAIFIKQCVIFTKFNFLFSLVFHCNNSC